MLAFVNFFRLVFTPQFTTVSIVKYSECFAKTVKDVIWLSPGAHSHIGDVQPEWVSFPGQKPADGCKFLTKNLRMGHNFDIILPGTGWFSSKLHKTYCSLVNFCCK